MVKIAINGFGRIGRMVFKEALKKNVQVVAINDINGLADAEYLLKYDSVYGKYPGKVSSKRNNLIVNGKSFLVLNEKDPEKLPWKKLGVDVVVESTGVFRDKEGAGKHIKAGAKRVIVTAPMKDSPDVTIVPGVNENKLKKSHKFISVASCTTNCASPVLKILKDNFGIKKGYLTTVHAYTSTQSLIDGSNKSPRRGRAAAVNLVPTTTGAAIAVIEAIPELKGKLDGIAIRAPVICGSITDLTVELNKKTSIEKINEVFEKAAKGKYKGILEYSDEELVSSDILGNNHSSIFDSKMTRVQGDFVKVLAWYDNETGYSSRVVDVVKLLNK
jgi:glyceraldehyde 3-phosphate dehydrogenase